MSFDLHQHFQKMMKEKAAALCGYRIVSGEPEERTYIQVDFFCQVDVMQPYTGPEKGIRPLKDFRRYNVVELEGFRRTLDESRFRYYLGRTMVMENPSGRPSRQGEIGLTILVVHKPVKLLAKGRYGFTRVTPWKYRSRFIDDIPVTIIVLRELQRIKGGEPAAWLQILEPDPDRRPVIWSRILEQELTGRERLKSVMMKIDKEAFMTVAEEYRTEGRLEGRLEGRTQREREIVQNLHRQGFDTEMIINVTGLTEAQLRHILEDKD